MRRITQVLTISLLLASCCFGRDIFVNARAGSDELPGSEEAPIRTIAKALTMAEAGDRIVLSQKGGPYRESVTLFGRSHSGKPDFPLVIEGNGAVLEGREPLPPEIWEHVDGDLFRFRPLDAPVDWTHFRLFNGDVMLTKIEVPTDVTKLPELDENTWCFVQGTVYFRAERTKNPLFRKDYELSWTQRMVGISLIQVRDVRIHDLVVQGFQRDGIAAANGARNVVLDGIECRQNGRSGLMIGGASRISAGFCRFENNAATQVLTLPYSQGLLYDCGVTEDDIRQATEHSSLEIQSGKAQ